MPRRPRLRASLPLREDGPEIREGLEGRIHDAGVDQPLGDAAAGLEMHLERHARAIRAPRFENPLAARLLDPHDRKGAPDRRRSGTCAGADGKPIPMLRFVDIYRKNSNKGIDEMIAVVRDEMKALVLHFEDLEGYEENLRLFNEQRIYKKRLDEQLQADQALARAIEHDMPFLDTPDKKDAVSRLFGQVWRFLWSIIGFIPRRLVDWLVALWASQFMLFATQ